MGADGNWIATYIEAALSIFVFLLGIPALVFQMFIPEDLRVIYNNHFRRKEIILLSLSLFFFIILLFYYSLNFINTNIIWVKPLRQVPYEYGAVFSLVAFILFSVYLSISMTFSKAKVYELLICEIIKKYKKNIGKKGDLEVSYIEDLSMLGHVLKPGFQTKFLISEVSKLIIVQLNDNYDGNKCHKLIERVLCESICHTFEAGSKENYHDILNIFEQIATMQETGMAMIDAKALKNCTLEIGLNSIKKNWIDLAIRSKDLLKKLPDSKMAIYSFSKLAFEREAYALVAEVVVRSIKKLSREENIARRHNVLAFISWFFCKENNNEMQKVGLELLIQLEKNTINKIDINDFNLAINFFVDNNDFYSANCLTRLRDRNKNDSNILELISA